MRILNLVIASMFFASTSFADTVADANRSSVRPEKAMSTDNSRQALHLCLSAVTGFAHVDVDHPDAHLTDINRNLNNPNGTYTLLKAYLELKSTRNKGAPAFLTSYGKTDEIKALADGFCACEKVKGIDMAKLKTAKASIINKTDIKARWSPMAEAATLRVEHLACK